MKPWVKSFNPLGLLTNQEQIPLRTTTVPYFTLRLAPNPLFRVSSHYPLLHPPTNSFWYRIGTKANSYMSTSTRNPASIFSEHQYHPVLNLQGPNLSPISPCCGIFLSPLASRSSQKLWHGSGTNITSSFVNFGLLHWGEWNEMKVSTIIKWDWINL